MLPYGRILVIHFEKIPIRSMCVYVIDDRVGWV